MVETWLTVHFPTLMCWHLVLEKRYALTSQTVSSLLSHSLTTCLTWGTVTCTGHSSLTFPCCCVLFPMSSCIFLIIFHFLNIHNLNTLAIYFPNLVFPNFIWQAVDFLEFLLSKQLHSAIITNKPFNVKQCKCIQKENRYEKARKPSRKGKESGRSSIILCLKTTARINPSVRAGLLGRDLNN